MHEAGSYPMQLVLGLKRELRAEGVKPVALGLFGSARHNPECRDIDVLLVVKTPTSAMGHDYGTEMDRIAGIMSGAGGEGVVDVHLTQLADVCVRVFNRMRVPVILAFGPSPVDGALNRATVHLNGPVSERLWNIFSIRFPIHVTSICRSFRRVMGTRPIPPARIDHTHVREMAALLKQRILNVGLSERFARKLVQALGTISGGKEPEVEELLRSSFAPGHPLMRAVKKGRLDSVPLDSMCDILLAELNWRAAVMARLKQVIHPREEG